MATANCAQGLVHRSDMHLVCVPVPVQVVECSFDAERRVWIYMRDRPDKLTANHRSVFDKVMASIEDNITVRQLQWVEAHILKRLESQRNMQ